MDHSEKKSLPDMCNVSLQQNRHILGLDGYCAEDDSSYFCIPCHVIIVDGNKDDYDK